MSRFSCPSPPLARSSWPVRAADECATFYSYLETNTQRRLAVRTNRASRRASREFAIRPESLAAVEGADLAEVLCPGVEVEFGPRGGVVSVGIFDESDSYYTAVDLEMSLDMSLADTMALDRKRRAELIAAGVREVAQVILDCRADVADYEAHFCR